MANELFVIVGAGLAGAKAAQALREGGFEGRVVLIGEETERPYVRPPLSKAYLAGRADRDSVHVHPQSFYEANDIELRTGTTVTAIDPSASEVTCSDGETLEYSRLLIATGCRARRLSIPGADLDGVHQLRTIADADNLRAHLQPGGSLVVIGAGWIGTEVAATAREIGMTVTIVHPGQVPLERVLGEQIGTIYRDLHVDHGVTLIPQTSVTRVEGTDRAEAVQTEDGRRIECDLVVAGIGAEPRVELAVAAGIATDNGILTDEYLQTSVPGIFAAGDIANMRHSVYGHLRIEHWANALNQGPAVAHNMLGGTNPDDVILDHPIPYTRVPYFYSDQYDMGMEYSGHATDWDDLVIRGDSENRRFIAFWLSERRILAAMNVNIWDVTDQLQALIRSRLRVDPARLADEDVPLTDLAQPLNVND